MDKHEMEDEDKDDSTYKIQMMMMMTCHLNHRNHLMTVMQMIAMMMILTVVIKMTGWSNDNDKINDPGEIPSWKTIHWKRQRCLAMMTFILTRI